MKRPFVTVFSVILGACIGGLGQTSNGQQQAMSSNAGDVTARAVIQRCDTQAWMGQAYLRERASTEGVKQVDIVMRVWQNSNLPAGSHAVHIHQTAACQPCGAAGGHFDPGPYSHTNPDGNHPFHAGDLVNLKVNTKGEGTLFATTTRVSLSPGPLSLFDEDGSAFIVHVDPDSYCPEGPSSGCAGGARAACGLIVRD